MTTLYISHRLEEIFDVGDDVTVLRDGQHVITRPLSGLAIPDIVELMVGRKLSDHGIFAATAPCPARRSVFPA